MGKKLLLSLAFLALQSHAADRSMTIFSDTYQLGSYKDFLSDVQINENGNAFNSALEEPFLPVGSGKTSSADVTSNYCGLLASGEFFTGSWRVLNPGRYDILSNFDNLTKSLLTYKMIGMGQTTCNPKRDIPMLYDEYGAAFPLAPLGEFNNTDTIPEYPKMFVGSQSDSKRIKGKRYIYNYPFSQYTPDGSYTNIDYAAGGFAQKAVTLDVPACYRVSVTGMKDDGTNLTFLSQKIFAAGKHNLANHGYSKAIMNASAFRVPNCVQPPVDNNFVLKHSGGMCIHPKGGSSQPAMNTPAILFPLCDNTQPRLVFSLLGNGSLSQVSGSACLHPEGGSATPTSGTRLVYYPSCSDGAAADAAGNKRIGFEFTSNGSIRHKNSGLCIQPRGGANITDTELVLSNNCNTSVSAFTPVKATGALCAASGKAGKSFTTVNLSNLSGSQIPAAMAAASGAAANYCSPCGIITTSASNMVTFACAQQ